MRASLRLGAIAGLALLVCGCAHQSRQVELEFWLADFNQATRDLIDKQLVPQFEAAHPGVKVNTQYISWAHLDEKLTISFAGGVAPDVFQVGAEYVGGLAYRGMAEPLDERVAALGREGRLLSCLLEHMHLPGACLRLALPFRTESAALP